MTTHALIPSCMGGWCVQRDHCPHYHAATPYRTPYERLCIPGRDGHSEVVKVVVRAPAPQPRIAFEEPTT